MAGAGVLERERLGIDSAMAEFEQQFPAGDRSVDGLSIEDRLVLHRPVRVQDLPEELRARQEFTRWVGSLAVGANVEVVDVEAKKALLDHIEDAARGNDAALTADLHLSLVEALLDVGSTGEVEFVREADGRFYQNGRLLLDALANTIEMHPGDHPNLHEVNYNEGMNGHVLAPLDDGGYFEDYIWVIPRLVPIKTPGAALRRYGYFENLAVAWSTVEKVAPGKFKMNNLFQSGVVPLPDEEKAEKMEAAALNKMYEDRLKRRHDLSAVAAIYKDIGLAVPASTEGYRRGFLWPKSAVVHKGHPHVDWGERYDEKLGPEYFLGNIAERENYIVDGERRAAALKHLIAEIPSMVRILVESRDRFAAGDHMAAADFVANMVGRRAVDYMIDHPEVRDILGPNVLGKAAYRKMLRYDQLTAAGDIEAAARLRNEIHHVARPNMCGHGGGNELSGESRDKKEDEDQYGSRTFQCKKGHTNYRPYGKLISHCQVCGIDVTC